MLNNSKYKFDPDKVFFKILNEEGEIRYIPATEEQKQVIRDVNAMAEDAVAKGEDEFMCFHASGTMITSLCGEFVWSD